MIPHLTEHAASHLARIREWLDAIELGLSRTEFIAGAECYPQLIEAVPLLNGLRRLRELIGEMEAEALDALQRGVEVQQDVDRLPGDQPLTAPDGPTVN